jgi:endoglucanase
MGMNFVDPKGPYDASKYAGITFWAKKAPGTSGNVRLKVPDNATDPDGGECTECFNDFGADLKISDKWEQYTILFEDMKQQKGWGQPRKSEINRQGLYGLQFQAADKGSQFDIWIDEIRFTGCGAPN